MIKLTITENEQDQRLDRFLKKYFRNAPLSYLYKLIRKGIKVNGKRASEDTKLAEGDEILIYISQEEAEQYYSSAKEKTALRQFRIAFEDEHTLIVEKPFGLLTHGTVEEKKNTLANQVIGYLIESGAYQPGRTKTFVPSPVNRLDRNTTGLVIFGKDYTALKAWNQMLRDRGYVRKFYTTIVKGKLESELKLADRMIKDRDANRIAVLSKGTSDDEEGKVMETIARPIAHAKDYTLVEVELVTGRSHQIRAHLASAGYPIIGDSKYGDGATNRNILHKYGLSTQFLHAGRLVIDQALPPMESLAGKEITAPLTEDMEQIRSSIFNNIRNQRGR
jgi:23S rRNA pseudouridine955/2504/2580 synthase